MGHPAVGRAIPDSEPTEIVVPIAIRDTQAEIFAMALFDVTSEKIVYECCETFEGSLCSGG
jgi:hypothetical protein